MFCASCGKQIEEHSLFCIHCGAKVKTLYGDENNVSGAEHGENVTEAGSNNHGKGTNHKRRIAVLIATVAAICLVIAIASIWKNRITRQVQPDQIQSNQTADGSSDEAEKIDIDVDVEKEAEAGQEASAEEEIKNEVPDVIGMTEEEATAALTELGMMVMFKYEHDSTKEEGVVIGQSMAAGATVNFGDEIILTLAMKTWPGGREKELELYEDVIEAYRDVLESGEYDKRNQDVSASVVFFPAIGYALLDLDEDGADELLIMNANSNPESSLYGMVLGIFALQRGRPQSIYKNDSFCNTLYLCRDKMFYGNELTSEGYCNQEYRFRYGGETELKQTEVKADENDDACKAVLPDFTEVISNDQIHSDTATLERMKGNLTDVRKVPVSLVSFLNRMINYRELSYDSASPPEIAKKRPHLLSYVLAQISCIDQSHYPQLQLKTDVLHDADPLRKYVDEEYEKREYKEEYENGDDGIWHLDGYRRYAAPDIDWILKNVFNCSEEYIGNMRTTEHGSLYWETPYPAFYYLDGYYYAVWEVGFGDPHKSVNIISITQNGNQYDVLYQTGDFTVPGYSYADFMNYARLEWREDGGIGFWSLLEFNKINEDGGTKIVPKIKLTGDNVNIRSKPSVKSEVHHRARKGTEFFLVDTVKDNAGTDWYKISENGRIGYIRSDLASVEER